jgi:Kef-type K+ transport system membrane component KefB
VPVVVGEIAAGVVIGRTGLGEIDTGDATVVSRSGAGFAMLMFVVGTHLPLRDDSAKRGWAIDLRFSPLVLFGLSALATEFGTSILIAGFAAAMSVALAREPRRVTQQLVGIAEGS